jgi:hypothetical protein
MSDYVVVLLIGDTSWCGEWRRRILARLNLHMAARNGRGDGTDRSGNGEAFPGTLTACRSRFRPCIVGLFAMDQFIQSYWTNTLENTYPIIIFIGLCGHLA